MVFIHLSYFRRHISIYTTRGSCMYICIEDSADNKNPLENKHESCQSFILFPVLFVVVVVCHDRFSFSLFPSFSLSLFWYGYRNGLAWKSSAISKPARKRWNMEVSFTKHRTHFIRCWLATLFLLSLFREREREGGGREREREREHASMGIPFNLVL